MKCAGATQGYFQRRYNDTTFNSLGLSTGRSYWSSCAIYIVGGGTGVAQQIGGWNQANTGVSGAAVELLGANQIRLNGVSAQSPYTTIPTDNWHVLALRVKIAAGANDEAQLYIDGVSIANLSGLSISDAAPIGPFWGYTGVTAGTPDLYFDDWVINDDQGADFNTLPSAASRVALVGRPASDVAIGAWTDQVGGVANLWATLDDLPFDTATYIKSTSAATQTYESTVTPSGLPSAATVTGVVVNGRHFFALGAGKLHMNLLDGASVGTGIDYNAFYNSVWDSQSFGGFGSRPAGGAWTIAAVDGLHLRAMDVDATANEVRFGELWLQVVYTLPSSASFTGEPGGSTW